VAQLHAAFVILALIQVAVGAGSGVPAPVHQGTPSQYARAVRSVESHIASTTRDKDAKADSQALYWFHGPQKKVHGTVIVFHGGFGVPADTNMTSKYLYRNGFNVYAPALAGHAYQPHRNPTTVLRAEMGGTAAKKILINDPVIGDIITRINNGSLMAPVHAPEGFDFNVIRARAMELFRTQLPQHMFEKLMRAMSLLVSEEYHAGIEKELHRYFETDHHRYDSDPFERLADVAALPGPVYAVGWSLGGVEAMYLAARAKYIDKMVLFAPFVESAAPKRKPEYRYLLEAVGALDLYVTPLPGGSRVPSRMLPAADLAGRLLLQDDILNSIRDNTATLCVFAEDDSMSDVDIGMYACRDRVTNKDSAAYLYSASEGLDHSVAPGPSNPYNTAILQETLRFLATGSLNRENMLSKMGDPSMPPNLNESHGMSQ
jgi:alpha-beta hydrolase superfamily lysophospholipase